MEKNIFINLIGKNWLKTIIKENESSIFLDKTIQILETKFGKIKEIYLVTDKILKIDNKIIQNYKSVKIIISNNFNYILKHFVSKKIFNKESLVLTTTPRDFYLCQFVKVYTLKHTFPYDLELIDRKKIEKKINGLDISYYNDYLFLQEKNNDSIGHKKTINLLKKYISIENLLEKLDSLEDEKLKGLFEYQRYKIEYYLFLKNFFITEDDFNY